MSRGFSSEMVDALSDRILRFEYFYEGVFDGSILRYWSGFGPYVWDSKAWAGDGKFQGLSSCRESLQSNASSGIVVTVSGVSETLTYLALASTKQSSTGKVWVVMFDEKESVIGSFPIFSGSLDSVSIDRSATSGAISFSYESRLIRFNEKREIRLTNELQQERYKGDKGFEYVNQLKGARIYWGRADPGRLRL